jgi:hypothetical protein
MNEIAPYAGFPPTCRPTWNDGTVSGYPKWIEFAPANSGKIGTVINLASGTVFGDFFEAGARITKADDTQVERARELHAARRSVKELRAERTLELGRPARTARRRRSRLSHS